MKAETYATTDLTMTKDAGRKMLFIPYVKVKSIKRAVKKITDRIR